MTTREVMTRLPEQVAWKIEDYRAAMKDNKYRDLVRAELHGYTKGLRDAGLITDQERRIIHNYGTI